MMLNVILFCIGALFGAVAVCVAEIINLKSQIDKLKKEIK